MNVLKSNAHGRVCKMSGCTTPLTIWNPNKYCFTHLHKGLALDQRKKELSDSDYNRKKYAKAYTKKKAII